MRYFILSILFLITCLQARPSSEVKIEGFFQASFGMKYYEVKKLYPPLKKHKGMKGDVFHASIVPTQFQGKKAMITFSFKSGSLFRVLVTMNVDAVSKGGQVIEYMELKDKLTKYFKEPSNSTEDNEKSGINYALENRNTFWINKSQRRSVVLSLKKQTSEKSLMVVQFSDDSNKERSI
ncbi:MAG: hypothetical protein GY909_15950 [Oligoflexia bacterium]|nr:hypothetical protein [Oligoflexia bacterium]